MKFIQLFVALSLTLYNDTPQLSLQKESCRTYPFDWHLINLPDSTLCKVIDHENSVDCGNAIFASSTIIETTYSDTVRVFVTCPELNNLLNMDEIKIGDSLIYLKDIEPCYDVIVSPRVFDEKTGNAIYTLEYDYVVDKCTWGKFIGV